MNIIKKFLPIKNSKMIEQFPVVCQDFGNENGICLLQCREVNYRPGRRFWLLVGLGGGKMAANSGRNSLRLGG